LFLRKLQEKLFEEKSYKQLIEELHDSVILTDKNNDIFYYNKIASEIFGFPYSKKKSNQKIQLKIKNIEIDLTNLGLDDANKS
jgi:PAS domain-containing protein